MKKAVQTVQTASAGNQADYFNMRDLYFQALDIAYQKFIVEERSGHMATELRLVEAIKAARALYRECPYSFDTPQARAWHAQFQS
jgi:hypothetical protein